MSALLSPQLTTALLVLGTIQLSRQFNLEDPTTINYVRIFYAVSQLAVVGILFFIKTKIEASQDKGTIEVDTAAPSFSNPNPSGEKKKMTIKEYDLSEWSAQLKQTLIPLALIVGLHLYIGFVQPLIIQSIIPLKALYSTPLFQVYILGKKTEGTLVRPWKKPNPLEGLIPTPPAAPQNNREQITEGTAQQEEDEGAPSQPPENKPPKTRKRNVPRDS
eukprot:Phypoly_transcript_18283.p1 GENE.Phypoly_transcript_18283~~Phypoly_transcript_18283.p1  ORF type:complete len:218 (-),score=37.35 Phypoly_transcript_18283:73-726(-)